MAVTSSRAAHRSVKLPQDYFVPGSGLFDYRERVKEKRKIVMLLYIQLRAYTDIVEIKPFIGWSYSYI